MAHPQDLGSQAGRPVQGVTASSRQSCLQMAGCEAAKRSHRSLLESVNHAPRPLSRERMVSCACSCARKSVAPKVGRTVLSPPPKSKRSPPQGCLRTLFKLKLVRKPTPPKTRSKREQRARSPRLLSREREGYCTRSCARQSVAPPSPPPPSKRSPPEGGLRTLFKL